MSKQAENEAEGGTGQPFDLPFSIDEYRSRLKRVQDEMAGRGLDLMLVHTLSSPLRPRVLLCIFL